MNQVQPPSYIGTDAAQPVRTTHPQATDRARLSYLPGLDGLRALAVFAVLLYHAELPWMSGGFLGVEVFFVLSGYLITALLVAEWRKRGSIDLPAFWLRRARRLLPALFTLLAATLLFAVVFLPDEVTTLRSDTLAASGYVTNWYLIFTQKPYFEMVGGPSLLQHLWSLAVEEQFYLLWPMLLVVGLRRWRVRRGMLLAVLAGAAASAGLMALLYRPDADPSRIYYGTDTRAAGLLIGCALAFVWTPAPRQSQAPRTTGAKRVKGSSLCPSVPLFLLPDMAGLCALGALCCFFVALDETQPFLYQGGLAATALATAAVIAVVVHPYARLVPGLLGLGLLRWTGLRSYGIYLWHWPVYAVTRPQLDVPLDGVLLFAVRLALTLALAEISYRCVEMPVRSGALDRAWRSVRQARGWQGAWLRLRWAGAALAGAVFTALLGASLVQATPPTVPSYLAVSEVRTSASIPAPTAEALAPQSHVEAQPTAPPQAAQSADTPRQPEPASATPAPGMAKEQTQQAPQQEAAASVPAPNPTPIPQAPQAPRASQEAPQATAPPASHEQGQASTDMGESQQVGMSGEPAASLFLPAEEPTQQPAVMDTVRIFALGDSVMIGAARELRKTFPNIDIDAVQGRQVSAGISVLHARRNSGKLGDVVVVHLGNNGSFSARQFDDMMRVLSDVHEVVFLNNKVQRRWEGSNNEAITAGVKRYPNIVFADWREASINHPEYFWKDLIHLRPAGARAYAQLIASAVNK